MKLVEKILGPFREVTGVLKDFGWWLGGVVAAIALIKPYWDSTGLSVTLHVAATIFLCYAFIRAVVYRGRNRRIYKALKYVHGVIHDLRNQVGEELKYREVADTGKSDERATDATIQSLHQALQNVLDAASGCFRELTGEACTAVLIMPAQSEEDGKHFKARLYSSNAPPERTKASRPHKSGLVTQAFKLPSVICSPDLRKEMEAGNFDKRDHEDPFKWYLSAILCHFKVSGEPWGVLAIDSPKAKAFRPYYNDLICAFADTCGLAFVLSEHGIFGHHHDNPITR